MDNLRGRLNNKAGIYKIENIKNNKVYVGSAIDLYRRRCEHISHLRKGQHINTHLQSAFNKYGEENFNFIILEFLEKIEDTILFKKEILKREQYWIDELKAYNRKYGYNKSPTAGNILGLRWTDEAKKAVSKKRKENPTYGMLGKKHSQETKDKIRNNKTRNKRISNALTGIKRSIESIEKTRQANIGRKVTKETKKKISIANSRENNFWYGKKYEEHCCAKKIINLTTGKIYDSIKRASEEYGLKSGGTINSVLIGKTKYAKKCLWAYLDENNNPILPNYIKKRGKGKSIINLDTLEVFDKIGDIYIKFDINKSHIHDVCCGKRKTCLGYHWQYYEDYLKEHPKSDIKEEK